MQTLQQAIKDAVNHCDSEACGDSGLHFHPNYSGRGMYGKSCIGVSGPKDVIMQLIAYIIEEAHCAHVDSVRALERHGDTDGQEDTTLEEAENCEEDAANFAQDAVVNLLDFSQDSMGYDVILYWPNLKGLEQE